MRRGFKISETLYLYSDISSYHVHFYYIGNVCIGSLYPDVRKMNVCKSCRSGPPPSSRSSCGGQRVGQVTPAVAMLSRPGLGPSRQPPAALVSLPAPVGGTLVLVCCPAGGLALWGPRTLTPLPEETGAAEGGLWPVGFSGRSLLMLVVRCLREFNISKGHSPRTEPGPDPSPSPAPSSVHSWPSVISLGNRLATGLSRSPRTWPLLTPPRRSSLRPPLPLPTALSPLGSPSSAEGQLLTDLS